MKAVLLLGQYSQHDQKQEYEVRSNLKNFTGEKEELSEMHEIFLTL